SPFTQRALREVEAATIYPAAELRHDLVEVTLADEETERATRGRGALVPVLDRPPDLVWQPGEVRSVWEEEGVPALDLAGAAELDPFPQGQQFTFDAQRPALAA